MAQPDISYSASGLSMGTASETFKQLQKSLSPSAALRGIESNFRGHFQGTVADAFHERVDASSTHFYCTPCDSEWYEVDAHEDVENESPREHAYSEESNCERASVSGIQQRTVVADFTESAQDIQVDPFTKDLVICNRTTIPRTLIQSFDFISDKSLVTGFTYDIESGEIVEEDGEDDDEDDLVTEQYPGSTPRGSVFANTGLRSSTVSVSRRRSVAKVYSAKRAYIRLITTNWWYQQLMFTFTIVSLIVMGKNANVIFCACLLSEGYDSPMPLWPRRFVALGILFLECFQVGVFYKIALIEWRNKSKGDSKVGGTGDLIVSKRLKAKDKNAPFWALVVFHILEIDILVKDLVKYVHPFKDKQPYAAFKADGHRAFMIGFRDSHSFQASRMNRPASTLLSQALIEAVCLIFKLLSAFKLHSIPYGLMSLPGLFIIYMKIKECFLRAGHREVYWKHLRAAQLFGDPGDKRASERARLTHFVDSSWEQEHLNERPMLRLVVGGVFVAVSVCACGLWYAIHLFNR